MEQNETIMEQQWNCKTLLFNKLTYFNGTQMERKWNKKACFCIKTV